MKNHNIFVTFLLLGPLAWLEKKNCNFFFFFDITSIKKSTDKTGDCADRENEVNSGLYVVRVRGVSEVHDPEPGVVYNFFLLEKK